MNIRFICAQPAIFYYTWQVEVMIKNFMSMGINPNMMDIVCYKENNTIPEEWSRLAQKYPARFFFYNDTRETKHYVSSIRPNILKQHFNAHPYLKDEAIFYHDCDIVFTKPIRWDKFLNDDIWYGSDCRWYIGHDYIISKGEDILDAMCNIVGIDKQLVKDNELNSIGAQYLMKGIDASFWEDVEKDSEKLFKDITDLNNQKIILDKHTVNPGEPSQPLYHPLQIWCADMWAVLWNGWKRGNQSICHNDLQFSWATSHIGEWDKYNINHNAGVVDNKTGLFYKGLYQKTPPPKNLEINDKNCSFNYYQLVKQL
jgi:hypothetical protein